MKPRDRNIVNDRQTAWKGLRYARMFLMQGGTLRGVYMTKLAWARVLYPDDFLIS